MDERDALILIGAMDVLRPEVKNELVETYGSATEVYKNLQRESFLQELIEKKMLSEKSLSALGEIMKPDFHKGLERDMRQNHIEAVTQLDEDFPESLLSISPNSKSGNCAPLCLFTLGRRELLCAERKVAIVGSRNPSAYGLRASAYFARELSKKKILIVSGMANGIDGESHRMTLKGRGDAIAVLGSGLLCPYPKENMELYRTLKEEGLLLSEYFPTSPPLAFHFPNRNRIIAGLSEAVLVTEAKTKSGSLITARWALEAGRDIYALPGRVGDPLSQGTNELIRDAGALLVTGVEDIFRNMYPITGSKTMRVFLALESAPIPFARIVEKSRLPVSDCMKCLEELRRIGLVEGKMEEGFACR